MLLTAGYIASKSDCKPPIRASGTDWLQRWGQRSSLLVIVRSAQYALPMQTLDNHASWCRGPLSIDFGWVIYKQRSVWVLNYEHQFHFRNSAISHIANETARFGSIIRQLYKKKTKNINTQIPNKDQMKLHVKCLHKFSVSHKAEGKLKGYSQFLIALPISHQCSWRVDDDQTIPGNGNRITQRQWGALKFRKSYKGNQFLSNYSETVGPILMILSADPHENWMPMKCWKKSAL